MKKKNVKFSLDGRKASCNITTECGLNAIGEYECKSNLSVFQKCGRAYREAWKALTKKTFKDD